MSGISVSKKKATEGMSLLPIKNKICQQGKERYSRCRKRWIAAALIALLALFSFATSAQAAWYDSNWQYRKKLTIDYTKVGATLSHFPVLVSLSSDSDLAAHARSDGYDILFTSSDGTTKLDHEIESCTTATGALVAWVRIPSLSNSADTDIYMYYGNASATDQQNKTGVWSDGGSNYYKGVWHLHNNNFNDSTSNGNNGANGGSTDAAGMFAGGRSFDGNDYIQVSGLLGQPANVTLSAWVKLTSADSDGAGNGGAEVISLGDHIALRLNGVLNSVSQGVLGFFYEGAPPWRFTETSVNVDTAWHYVAYTFDDTGNTQKVNIDGQERGSSIYTTSINYTGLGANTLIGRNGDLWGAVDFNGVIDEVRVSSSVRTLSWIATEYNNQSNPGPDTGAFFKTLGSQETNTDVDLADHAAGQEADKFTSASSVTGAELFAFKLTNNTASSKTVDQIVFPLTSVTNISQGDFANLAIYVDANNDGTIGAGETSAVGGAGAVDGSVTTITFSTPFNISASTAVNYILIGDVNNLVPSDTVTIGLGTANITLASGTVGGTAPTSISHTKDSGEVYSYRKPITIDHTQVGASCTSTTDTWQVSANNRDAWDDQTNGDLNQAFFGDSDWRDAGGYQWALEIPQGAIITSAKIRVYSTFHSGVTGAYTARIRVEDVDSASAFTGVVNDIYSRTYWGTTVDWSIPAGGLPINTWSESPDIAALVQHVVDRAGWSPGNYLSIGIWGQTGNGGSNEYTRDYSSNASQAAQLEVTYQSATDSIQDFPVMVKLTGTDFQEVEDNVDADGYDIIFKAEDDTTCGGVGLAPCTLDHEIEVYDETNDLLVAWVRVPTLSATADTTIYIYYGNSSITSPTENPTGVWDSDYVAVWHLHDDFDDSTGSNNGTNYGSSSATGQIADGQDFDGTDDYATMPTGGFSTSAGTVEAWVNIDSFPSSGPEYVFAHRQASPTTDRVYIQLWDNTTWGTGMGDTYDLLRGSTLNIDTWYHLVIRWDGTNVRGYRNGSLDFGPTSYAGLSTVREIFVMAWDPTMEWADGTLDELRISKVARDACWIETEYSNQNDPSTFINIGPEVVIGPSVAVSGTITSSTTENDIVSGSKTIVITLTGDTWVPAGAEFDAQRQNIIDGLNSAQSEANGWNNEVRDKQSASGVVRTSDTLVTVTLDAQAAYDISANETITVTVPASALVTSTSPLVASPTFDVSYFAPSPLTLTHYRWRNDDRGESVSAGWWNVSYLYRKKITCGTSHSLLPLGYTVTVPMDTRPANTNVELTSGNDVRVVWQPTAGGAVELARIGDTWNSAATNIDFRLQSEIGANLDEDPDGSYYVYYGNAAAGTPPTNEMNVYYFADFFNRANSSTVGNGWTEWNDSIASDMYIQSNALYSEGNNVGPPDAGVKRTFPLGALTGNFTLSFDITIQTNAESTWTHYVNVGSSATMVNPNRTMGVGPGIYFGEGGHFVPNSDNYNISNDLTDNMETGITGAQSIRMVVNRGAQTYDYYRGGTLRASGQTYVTSQATLNQIRIANDQYSNTEAAFVYDNVKIVLDVADAPEEALGSEEPYQASGATWAANEDTPLTGLAIGTNIRVRFLVANQGGAGSGPVAYQLEMAETATCGSGSYSAVPGTASSSEHWEILDPSYINDGQSTFNIDPGLTDPLTGNFTNGELRDDNSNTTGAIDLAAGDFTEIEFAIKTTDYATNGGSYCFRLYDSTNGVALGPSTAYAQVTLASGIFQYRKPITIPSGKVSCAPYIENFPLLVKITD
jgi:hypothetical protein